MLQRRTLWLTERVSDRLTGSRRSEASGERAMSDGLINKVGIACFFGVLVALFRAGSIVLRPYTTSALYVMLIGT
jgi:hypothetical protein